jgi:hypothetical protein
MTDDPTRHLTAAVAPAARVADGYANPVQVLDYASPTAWLNTAIADLTGYDVLETLVRPFSGDWERIGRYSDALGHIAACLGEMAVQVQSQTIDMTQRWSGNASDTAYVYFSETATSLSRHAAVLRTAEKRYKALALDAWQLSQGMQGILQGICDRAVVALLEIAAGTALAETGVGTVAGYALAAAQIAAIVKLIARASRIVQSAETVIALGFAGITGALIDLGDLRTLAPLDKPYRNPVVVRPQGNPHAA